MDIRIFAILQPVPVYKCGRGNQDQHAAQNQMKSQVHGRSLLSLLGNSARGSCNVCPLDRESRRSDTHGYNRDSAILMATQSSLDWFPLWLSLRVASLATLFVLSFGTLIAYTLSHKDFRGKNFLDSVITLPLVLPPTVLGYYLLVLVGRASPLGRVYESLFVQPLVFTWQAAVVAAFLHSAPIYIKAARAILEGVDHR